MINRTGTTNQIFRPIRTLTCSRCYRLSRAFNFFIIMENQHTKTPNELTDKINLVIAIETTIRELNNIPWVSLKNEDGRIWWRNLNHNSEVNPIATLSPQLILREVEEMEVANLVIKIIGIFNGIDNWKKEITDFYSVDDLQLAYNELPQWIASFGDKINDHLDFYEPVACAGDIEIKLKSSIGQLHLITAGNVVIKSKDKGYFLYSRKNVEYYNENSLII